MDEARIGLKPVVVRAWNRRGRRLIVNQCPGYKSLYLYGFVCPMTGETVSLLMPEVSAEAFQLALEHFAQQVGAGPEHHIALVIDQAGFHIARKITPPEGIHLFFLPAYSPELQPAERLWPLAREAVANRPITDLDEVHDLLAKRCIEISQNQEQVKALTCYHWWREAVAA